MSCRGCLKYADNKKKKELMPKAIRFFPCMEVGCDRFEWNNRLLVVVDALSNYPEVFELPDLRSTTVINKTNIFQACNPGHGLYMVLPTLFLTFQNVFDGMGIQAGSLKSTLSSIKWPC